MNYNAIRYVTWTKADLKEYFGIPRGTKSQYLKGQDFRPGVLAEVKPKQLHETAIQADGNYVHIEMGGVPAQRKDVVAMLEIAIPYDVMARAMDYLKANDWDAWRTLDVRMKRAPLDTAEMIASKVFLSVAGLYKQTERGIDGISKYLDWYFDVQAEALARQA